MHCLHVHFLMFHDISYNRSFPSDSGTYSLIAALIQIFDGVLIFKQVEINMNYKRNAYFVPDQHFIDNAFKF